MGRGGTASMRTMWTLVGVVMVIGMSSLSPAQTLAPGVLGRDVYVIGCQALRAPELHNLGIQRGKSGVDCRMLHLIPDILPTEPTMGLNSVCVAPSTVHDQLLPDGMTPVACIDSRWVVERTLAVYRRGGRETVCEYHAQLEYDAAGTVRQVFFDSCGL